MYIVMEEVMPGWSLGRVDAVGEDAPRMGLIPRSHYTLTSKLELSPQVIANTPPTKPVPLAPLDNSPATSAQESPSAAQPLAPIEPQITGAPTRALRTKSFNRFASFVTSGAEDWINNGAANDLAPSTEARRNASDDSQNAEGEYNRPEMFFTEVSDASPSARYIHSSASVDFQTPPIWRSTAPQFHTMVHSPAKQTSTIGTAYTVYSVTSMFPESSVAHITVFRRFSQFAFLHAALTRRLPGIALPPLPGMDLFRPELSHSS